MLKKLICLLTSEISTIPIASDIIDEKDFNYHMYKRIRIKTILIVIEQSYSTEEIKPYLDQYEFLKSRYEFLNKKIERYIEENG